MGIITNKLISHYPLDSNLTDAIDSNNWTNSGITYTTGKINNCAVFNLAEKATISGNPFTGSVALGAWINADRIARNKAYTIFSYGGSDYPLIKIYISDINGTNSLKIRCHPLNNISYNEVEADFGEFSNDTWYHIVVGTNGANWVVWVNGVAQTLSVLSGSNTGDWVDDITTPTSGITSLGVAHQSGSDSDYWDGWIDNLEFFDTLPTTEDIEHIYNSGSGRTLATYDFIRAGHFQEVESLRSENFYDTSIYYLHIGIPNNANPFNHSGSLVKISECGDERWYQTLNVYDVSSDNLGNVYVRTSSTQIKKYDKDGVLQWTYTMPSGSGTINDFTSDNKGDYIYLCSDYSSGLLRKIDSSTGNEVSDANWPVTQTAWARGGPNTILIGRDDKLYVLSDSVTSPYASQDVCDKLDPSDASVIWYHQLASEAGAVTFHSIDVDEDGRVVVGGYNATSGSQNWKCLGRLNPSTGAYVWTQYPDYIDPVKYIYDVTVVQINNRTEQIFYCTDGIGALYRPMDGSSATRFTGESSYAPLIWLEHVNEEYLYEQETGGTVYSNWTARKWTLDFTEEWTYKIPSHYTGNDPDDGVPVNHIDTGKVGFPACTVTVTSESSGEVQTNGGVTISGEYKIEYNQSSTLYFNADTGYIVSDVLVDGVSQGAINNYTFSNISGQHTLHVVFALATVQYTISAEVSGEHGIIEPSGEVIVNETDNQPFNFTPDLHYGVDDVVVDSVSQGPSSSYTFYNVSANHTISVSFSLLPTFIITASAQEHVSISPSGEIPVYSGENQAFNINADPGYDVYRTLVDGVDQGSLSSYTFYSVTEAHTIHVTYIPENNWVITSLVGPHGSVDKSGEVFVPDGSGEYFNYTPDEGYETEEVYIDDVPQGQTPGFTQVHLTNVTYSYTLRVTFQPIEYTVTASAGSHGSISPSGETKYLEGADATYNMNPDPGYMVDDITVDSVSQGAASSYTFQNINNDHTISVTFTPEVYYTITASAEGSGEITPSGEVPVLSGYDQLFEFSGEPGFVITDVLVDSVSQGTPSNYLFENVNDDHTIQVTFGKYILQHITATYGEHGHISPSGEIEVIQGSDQVINFYPDPGYSVGNIEFSGELSGASGEYQDLCNEILNLVNQERAAVGRRPLVYNSELEAAAIEHTNDMASNEFLSHTGSDSSTPFSRISANGYFVDMVTSAYATGENIANGYTTAEAVMAGWMSSPGHRANILSEAYTEIGISRVDSSGEIPYYTQNFGYRYRLNITLPNVKSDYSMYVPFVLGKWTITVIASANGTTNPSGVIPIADGGYQSLIFVPEDGYLVEDVLINGFHLGSITEYTIGPAYENYIVTVTYKEPTLYTITATAGLHGKIEPSGEVQVNDLQDQGFTFTASGEYEVDDVLIDSVSQGAMDSYLFEDIDDDHTIHVSFKVLTYEIAVTTDSHGIVTPSGEYTHEILPSGELSLQFSGEAGYVPDYVRVDGRYLGPLTSYEFTNVQKDHTVYFGTKSEDWSLIVPHSVLSGFGLFPAYSLKNCMSGFSSQFSMKTGFGMNILQKSILQIGMYLYHLQSLSLFLSRDDHTGIIQGLVSSLPQNVSINQKTILHISDVTNALLSIKETLTRGDSITVIQSTINALLSELHIYQTMSMSLSGSFEALQSIKDGLLRGDNIDKVQSMVTTLTESTKAYQSNNLALSTSINTLQSIKDGLLRGDNIGNIQSIINKVGAALSKVQAVRNTLSSSLKVLQAELLTISDDPVNIIQEVINKLLSSNEVSVLQKNLGALSDLGLTYYSVPAEIYLDGKPLSRRVTSPIRITYSEDSVHNELTFTSADPDLFILCDPEFMKGEVRIEAQVGNRMMQFIIISREGEDIDFSVTAISYSDLDDGQADDMSYALETPTLASTIAENLAVNCVLDWQPTDRFGNVFDWMVPIDFSFAGKPLDGITTIASSIGALVRCQDDGSLLVRNRRPIRPIDMPFATPDLYCSGETIISLSHSEEAESGYNAVNVEGYQPEHEIPMMELEPFEDGHSPVVGETVWVRVYWAGMQPKVSSTYVTAGNFDLVNTGAENDLLTRREEDVTVEFIDGKASLSYPIKELLTYRWEGYNPGDITYNINDKELSVPDEGFGVAVITYTTEYQRYVVKDHNVDELITVLFLDVEPSIYASVSTEDEAKFGPVISEPLLTTNLGAVIRGTAWIDANKYRKDLLSLEIPYNDNAIDGKILWVDDNRIDSPGYYHIKSSTIVIDGPKVTNELEVERCRI